jgi:signal transduction histidine kinase
MEKPPFTSGLKDFLSLGLAKCMHGAQARSGSIFIYDKENDELVLEVARNSRGVPLEGIKLKVGEGIAGSVALNKKPLLVRDTALTSLFQESPHDHNYASRSFLSVPWEHSGNLLGVINLTDRISGETFSSEDLNKVLHISRDLGGIMHSLKSYADNQRLIIKELQHELTTMHKSLEHAKKFSSLGKLAGGFVHELNNPLDGIIRYVNLAYDNLEEDGVAQEYLTEAKEGLNRVVKIVRSLLDFSWNLSRTPSHVDINRAIDESLFMMHDRLRLCGVKVIKNFSPHMPMIPDYRLKLVFINLIKNACIAMSQNGGLLHVATAVHESRIDISISDTGEGMPPEIQDKIFEPFFTTRQIGEGAGLGLAICYETIQRYHGQIKVISKPNEGATFVISLPVPGEGDDLSKI